MPDHAQDKRRARALITSVLAADCACAPGDLLTSGTTFSLAREIPGRRRYPLLDPSLLIVTTGHGVAIAASEGRLDWLRTRLADRERDEIFAATSIVELAELVAPDDQVIIGPTVSYACSRDTFRPTAAPHDVDIQTVEREAIPALYAHPGFDHALAYRTRMDRQDRIAAVARRKGEIVGIAGCSDDAEALWQIGIDVVPGAQGAGIGRALVSVLTARILEDGKVPFYTAAASNIASCSLALGLGYWPACGRRCDRHLPLHRAGCARAERPQDHAAMRSGRRRFTPAGGPHAVKARRIALYATRLPRRVESRTRATERTGQTMTLPQNDGPFRHLFEDYKAGRLSRRHFIERATALGMGAGVALYCVNAVPVAAAQEASPGASSGGEALVPGSAADRPTAGTESQQRGAGGDLRIIQWQAPSHLSGPTSTGDKDNLGASLVSESLLLRLPDGRLIPNLVKEVPTVENGLLAEDFTSVTYNLLEGVLWSDGQPFTANDVVFTWRWIMDDSNGATSQGLYAQIANMEAVDDLTVRVTFNEPNPTWSDTQTGQGSSVVLPAHILEGGGKEANDAFRLNPIGTGPYKVESFAANDQVVYVVNENYREPTKPFFGRVTIKGGGDAASAARAVIQTGEYDYAWNLAIEPEIARSFESEGSPGVLLVSPGLGIERININFSDPRAEVTTEVPSATPEAAPTQVTQRSEKNTPHPIFSDIAVRQAMNLAIDRETIANSFFFGGEVEPAVVNILSGIPALESPNTELVYDPEGAAALLDGAGWVLDGDVRTKDGVELSIDYMTTVSQLRQKIQAVVKRDLEAIGFRVELKSVDAAIFFDSAEGNEQNNTHFYNDLNMFTSGVGSPPPVAYMIRWYAGPDGRNIAQAQNAWTGRNFQRYQNPEYDALYEASRTESDPEAQAQLFIGMNDILFNDAAVLPLVRTGDKIGYARTLNVENIAPGPYEFDYWNIANWNRVS